MTATGVCNLAQTFGCARIQRSDLMADQCCYELLDQFGAIVLLNVQAKKQFNYRRDELLGQQVANIIPEGFAELLIADGSRTAAEALAQQIV